jgi:hypothetical protein
MSACEECGRSIPPQYLGPLISSAGMKMSVCGICALQLSNIALGIKRRKFHGENAEAMRQAAIKHYRKTKQL